MKKLVIKKEDLVYNIQTIKNICNDSTIIAVLKGNGYGLGIVEFASLLIENNITNFAVSELSEAVALRNNGFENDILLLSPTNNIGEAKMLAQLEITATVGSVECARILNETGIKTKAHIKIDTGFGRFGFSKNDIENIAIELLKFGNIEYEGVFSHLSNSFGKDSKSSKKQFDIFINAVDKLKNCGISPKIRHICNSCGALRFDYARLDAVRIGSAFLGRLPMDNIYNLKRIAHLSCEISEIKVLPKNHNVGYANTYNVQRQTKIAVVPVGYKDGFGVEKSKDTFRPIDILRYIYADIMSINKKLFVRVNNKNAKIIGRISMYNIIIDITDIDAKIGDIVTLECNPILIESTVRREYI